MAGLPDDLRSLANHAFAQASGSAEMLRQAADRIDTDAARILRLEDALDAIIVRAKIAMDESPEPIGYSDEWVQDLKMKVRPGVTLTEDPTRMPMLVSDIVPPGVVEVRVGDKIVCKIIGIGK